MFVSHCRAARSNYSEIIPAFHYRGLVTNVKGGSHRLCGRLILLQSIHINRNVPTRLTFHAPSFCHCIRKTAQQGNPDATVPDIPFSDFQFPFTSHRRRGHVVAGNINQGRRREEGDCCRKSRKRLCPSIYRKSIENGRENVRFVSTKINILGSRNVKKISVRIDS